MWLVEPLMQEGPLDGFVMDRAEQRKRDRERRKGERGRERRLKW